MKKIGLLFAFILIAAISSAQYGTAKDADSEFSLSTDTVTNTETVYMTVIAPDREVDLVIQPDINNVSGTTAGTALLQARIAGNWVTLNSDNSDLSSGQDTLTLVDNASTLWNTKIIAPEYRVAFVSTGNHVSIINAKFWYLKIE